MVLAGGLVVLTTEEREIMAQDKQNKREFSAGMILADGLAELVESLLEDLGPTGLQLTGIQPLATAIRKLGVENKFMTHGFDVVVRTAVRAAGLPAPLREFLTEFFDAYFDKVKTLASNPREHEVYHAREMGKQKAMDRLRIFLKKATVKPSFSALVLQLDEQDFAELFSAVQYLKVSNPKEHEAWNSLKESIASVAELQRIIKSAQAETTVQEKAKRMMECLRFLHSRNPNPMDDFKAFLKGEKTPQIKKLADTLKEATAALNKQADTWHARAEAIRAKRRSR